MGYQTEFNYILVLKEDFPKKIEVEKNYLFEKKGQRVYPRGLPIDLCDKDWMPHAKIIIDDITINEFGTRGSYRVIYKYNAIEKRVLASITKKTLLQFKE